MRAMNKIKWLLIVSLTCGCLSCNSWLDVDLVNEIEEQELFSTPEGFKEALAGVYADMATEGLYGAYLTWEALDIWGRIYDNTKLSSTYAELKEYNYTDAMVRSRINNFWNRMYTVIEETNNILRWANTNASVLSEEELNQIRGEALGCRSYLFFDLIRLFAPDVKVDANAKRVPYNTTFGVDLAPLYTTSETLDLILEDLQEAERCLANDPIVGTQVYELSNKNTADQYVARMNLYAVKALMARIYLDKGDLTNARIKAQEVISSNCFALQERSEVVQATADEKDLLFSDEHIFSLRNENIADWAETRLVSVQDTSTSGNIYLPFSINYVNTYDISSLDVRWMEWFSVFTEASITRMIKYYASAGNQNNYFPKVPLIRLSEMYMLLSESYLEEDINQAKAYADTLRIARIGEEGILTNYSENAFIQEMRREFPGEGQMFFMYKRRNHDIVQDAASGGNVTASEHIFVLPIPDAEIENGNVEQ